MREYSHRAKQVPEASRQHSPGRRRTSDSCIAVILLFVLLLPLPVAFGWWSDPWIDPWQSPRLEPEVLEPFVDGVLGAQIAAYQVPGAVISVVHDGVTILAKGYGLADVTTATPVRAERTLFRAGSVAKVLTWMALLQLAEAGTLALDQDVNSHLGDLALPPVFPTPVTPFDLSTHSAGFEDRFGGLFAANADSLLTLPEYLRRYSPAQVRPPRQLTAYSNYGAALSGHLVERVTGTPFSRYVAGRLLEPLGMRRSTFAQPVPEPLRTDLATGYDKRLQPLGFEWLQGQPSGALSTTATDMARLIKTILGGGRLDDARVLEETSVELMLTRQFGNDLRLAGLTFGFQEYFLNGQRLLWHPGDTLAFSSALVLIPAQRLGLFIAYNRLADSQPRADFLKTFMDRFFPAPPTRPPMPDPGAVERGQVYAGSYIPSRSNFTGPERLFKLFRPITVDVLPDGHLHMHGLWAVKDGLWVELGPGMYQHIGSQEIAIFRLQNNGVVLLEGNYPQGAYLKLPWYGAHNLHGLIWIAAAFGFLSSVGVGAFRLLSPRLVHQSNPTTSRWPRRLVETMSLVQGVVLFGLLMVLVNLRDLASQIDPILHAFGPVALLGAGLAVAAVLAYVWVWWHRTGRPVTRLFYSGVAILGMLFSLSLMYWRVLPLPGI